MSESIIKKTLDTVRQNRTATIYAVQTDYSARFIDAIITCDNVPIAVEAGATVTINALRRDNQSKAYSGTVNDNGSVRVPVTQWMLELEGVVVCTISVFTSETKLSTTQFIIEVQKTPYSGTTISEDDPEYDLFLQVLAGESERVAAEAERVAAEEERKKSVVQTIGDSTTAVMSQKATTDAINSAINSAITTTLNTEV